MPSLPSKTLEDHMKQHNFSNDKQCMGLQKLLLLNMTEHWKIALGSSKMVGVLFIDLKKAFDSVNHKMILCKVQGMGITGLGIQCTKVGYGVPQGSQLKLRLFKIYVIYVR